MLLFNKKKKRIRKRIQKISKGAGFVYGSKIFRIKLNNTILYNSKSETQPKCNLIKKNYIIQIIFVITETHFALPRLPNQRPVYKTFEFRP